MSVKKKIVLAVLVAAAFAAFAREVVTDLSQMPDN